MELVIVIWLGSALAAGTVAGLKHRSSMGWGLIGLLLGPLALLGALVVPKDTAGETRWGLQTGRMRRCPACAEAVQAAALKCRYCQSDLPPPPRRDVWGREIRK